MLLFVRGLVVAIESLQDDKCGMVVPVCWKEDLLREGTYD